MSFAIGIVTFSGKQVNTRPTQHLFSKCLFFLPFPAQSRLTHEHGVGEAVAHLFTRYASSA